MVAVARRVALSVLVALDRSNETLDAVLSRTLEKKTALIRRDRALVTELVFGVLRWRKRLDWVIQHTSSTPLKKIDSRILQILRLGLYQILFLSKIPAAVAVDESVALAKKKSPRWVAGFVNGVLRTAVRKSQTLPLPDETLEPVLYLSVRESHPSWLVERWAERLGWPETEKLCRANNQIPPVTIRVNTLKTDRQALAEALSSYVEGIQPTPYGPDGLILQGLKCPVGRMAPFREGLFQVQDEAAQIITVLLNPKPGEKILDACAGVGGKTGHMAQLMDNTGSIVAVDTSHHRLQALTRAMARLAIRSVETHCQDASISFPDSFFHAFDRILIDAPCSGLGVIRRNPDTKWRKKEGDLSVLSHRQKQLLGALSPLLRKNGVLVYSVCSMEPEEGEAVVDHFLKTHDDFVIDDTVPRFFSEREAMPGKKAGGEAFYTSPGIFRSLPHHHHMDGFFGVRLKRV